MQAPRAPTLGAALLRVLITSVDETCITAASTLLFKLVSRAFRARRRTAYTVWQRAAHALLYDRDRMSSAARVRLLDRIVSSAVTFFDSNLVHRAYESVRAAVGVAYFLFCAHAGIQSVGVLLTSGSALAPASSPSAARSGARGSTAQLGGAQLSLGALAALGVGPAVAAMMLRGVVRMAIVQQARSLVSLLVGSRLASRDAHLLRGASGGGSGSGSGGGGGSSSSGGIGDADDAVWGEQGVATASALMQAHVDAMRLQLPRALQVAQGARVFVLFPQVRTAVRDVSECFQHLIETSAGVQRAAVYAGEYSTNAKRLAALGAAWKPLVAHVVAGTALRGQRDLETSRLGSAASTPLRTPASHARGAQRRTAWARTPASEVPGDAPSDGADASALFTDGNADVREWLERLRVLTSEARRASLLVSSEASVLDLPLPGPPNAVSALAAGGRSPAAGAAVEAALLDEAEQHRSLRDVAAQVLRPVGNLAVAVLADAVSSLAIA